MSVSTYFEIFHNNNGSFRFWQGRHGWGDTLGAAHLYRERPQAERAIKRNNLGRNNAKYMTYDELVNWKSQKKDEGLA